MKAALFFVASFLFSCIQCYDSESVEYNGIEVSPLYETIIYSDIADIINEFENNNAAFEKANNESESEEDVEDLLSEYHHYLGKAHKQRLNYLEKNKLKNKVPIVRHEKFTKMKTALTGKHNEHYKNGYYNSDHNKFVQQLNPFDMFIPYNAHKYITTEQPAHNNDLSAFKKIIMSEETPMSPLPSVPVKSSRTCKSCSMLMDHMPGTNPNIILPSDEDKTYILNNPLSPEQSDDTINIRIKVDVQLPKSQQDHPQFYNLQNRGKMSDYNAGVSKEYLSAIKLPPPYFNFPIPMNLFGYKKMPIYNKYDSSPLHKITIQHKKKKPKSGNNNKKHRKKIVTFHNIKIDPQSYQSQRDTFNMTLNLKNETEGNDTLILNLQTNNTIEDVNVATANPVDLLNVTTVEADENMFPSVNITNNTENRVDEKHKTENSIETEFVNATTDKVLHILKKREIVAQNKSSISENKSANSQKKTVTVQKKSISQNKSTKLNKKNHVNKKTSATLNKSTALPNTVAHDDKKSTISQIVTITPQYTDTSGKKLSKPKSQNKSSTIKNKVIGKNRDAKREKILPLKSKKNSTVVKLDRNLPTDSELLYWPNNNGSQFKDISKNITAIILESEHKKAKLNMTKDTLRHNHTRALEQAIFGNVDWNDVDTVAPAFVSFVGKYIEGLLTFCNEHICHSITCTKKTCLHRVCTPKERFHNKGHCMGSNSTDSGTSMESIMDLPSKVAFEIVDILQDRMIGKLFGKITLCINNKCITFAASKKIFQKNKCTLKELSPKGHCVNSKEGKVA